MQSMIDFGGRHIYHDRHENTERNRICSHQMDLSMRSFIFKMGTIFFSFLVAVISPAHAYFILGHKTTTTEMHMPFCTPKSDTEFKLNVLLQFIIAGHGIWMYIIMEVIFTVLENFVGIAPKLVTCELAEAIQLHADGALSEAEFDWRVNKAVVQTQDTDRYT